MRCFKSRYYSECTCKASCKLGTWLDNKVIEQVYFSSSQGFNPIGIFNNNTDFQILNGIVLREILKIFNSLRFSLFACFLPPRDLKLNRLEAKMKKSMKLTLLSSISMLAISMLAICACTENFTPKMEIDAESAKSSFKNEILISPMDDSVKINGNKIKISPKSEDSTYTISGYFDGQIKVETKNTVIKLKNAYLENSSGKPAILAKAKIEISTTKDSTNYIVSRGRGFAKNAALQSKRSLILGGSGTLFIKGGICHAVEAEDVKIKGSGVLYLEGTKRGSALTCESLEVERDKTFTAFFLNAKNGIKADKSILIQSGNFHLYDNENAFKTDITKSSTAKTHTVTLKGGSFFISGNKNLCVSDEFVNETDMQTEN